MDLIIILIYQEIDIIVMEAMERINYHVRQRCDRPMVNKANNNNTITLLLA